MKKILHIPNYIYPHIGGIEQVCRDSINALKDNYEQKVICFSNDKKTVYDEVDGIPCIRVGVMANIKSQSIALGYGKELKKVIKSFKPDIVIFHYPNPFVASFLTKYLKKKEFKFILWWHLDITKQKVLSKFFVPQTKKLLKFADKVVATSPNYIEGSKFLSSNKDKCEVISCCISRERLITNDNHILMSKQIKDKYIGKTILFGFGRHVPYKGLTYLIKASKYLDDSYKILIGGSGPLTEELKKEAEGDKKIEFLGRISDDELKAYFLATDIFCFPSITKNEAFGIGLAEAMYYHLPCITFTIPGSGVNYVSINNLTGLEVNNGDYVEFANTIKILKNDESLRLMYGENAYQRCEELFFEDTFNEKINNLLKEIEE